MKVIRFELKADNKGTATLETDRITGLLEGIEIVTESFKLYTKISIKNTDSYLLKANTNGSRSWYPVRFYPCFLNGELATTPNALPNIKRPIDNKLTISIEGQHNVRTLIKLYLED